LTEVIYIYQSSIYTPGLIPGLN